MMEFESSHMGLKKKKLFKLYISAYDYKNNDKNDNIILMIGIPSNFQSFHSRNSIRKKLLIILKQKWIIMIRLPIGN